MDSTLLNLVAPVTKDVNKVEGAKSTTISTKSNTTSKEKNETSFDSTLEKVTSKDIKENSESVIKDKTKVMKKGKAIELQLPSEEEESIQLENSIMALISTMLQIPQETIKETLQEMNITPTDLLQLDTFKEFVNVLYPEMNQQDLLLTNENLKNISKLFGELQKLSEVVEGADGKFLVEKSVANDEVIETKITPLNELLKESGTEEPVSLTETPIHNQEVKEILGQHGITRNFLNQQVATKEEEVSLVADGNVEETLIHFKEIGLGLTVPIQGFTHTYGVNPWEDLGSSTALVKGGIEAPIVNQILDKIEIKTLNEQQEVKMQLSPKELGTLSIKLTETNGVLVADIKVENDKAKELILNEIDKLKQMLQKQGLEVGEVKVDVRQNSHQSQMEQQKQKSSRRIQELIQKHLYTEEQPEEVEQQRVSQTEVDYMV